MSLSYLLCLFLLFSASVSFPILPIGNQDFSGVKVADPTFLVNFCTSTRDLVFTKSIHCLICKGFHYSCWHTTTPTPTTPSTTTATTKNTPTVESTTPTTVTTTTSKPTSTTETQE